MTTRFLSPFKSLRVNRQPVSIGKSSQWKRRTRKLCVDSLEERCLLSGERGFRVDQLD
jgi:hypothetical protein